MTEHEAAEFLSLPPPRMLPAAMRRRIRDAILPRPFFFIIIAVTMLIIMLASFLLFFILVPLRFGADLLLDFGQPSLTQGTVLIIREVSLAPKSHHSTLVSFIFETDSRKELSGTCFFTAFSGKRGDEVQVEYMRQFPNICRISGSTLRPVGGTYSIVVMTLLLFPLSLAPFVFIKLQCRKVADLLTRGMLVYGTVLDIKKSRPGSAVAHISFTRNGISYTVRDTISTAVATTLKKKQQDNSTVMLCVAADQPNHFFLMQKILAS